MSLETDPSLTQPDRHPFPTQWLVRGSLDDVLLRFFWNVPLKPDTKRQFEKELLDEADRLIEENRIHDIGDEFEWRTRSRPKSVPKETPLAHKVEVYGDFITSREGQGVQAVEPIHQLLDALHKFQPPIILVKVEIG